MQIKPPSGGSGAGADVTKIVESAQCLYAAMIYECKDLRVVSEADLKCGQAFSDTPGVNIEQILALDSEEELFYERWCINKENSWWFCRNI